MTRGWRNCKLGDVITLKRGYDLPNQERKPGPFPVVSSSGITDHHAEAKVTGPGVVTGRYGTLGQVFLIVGDFWPLNTSLYVSDFKGNDPRFVSYLLRTLNFATQNAAGAVPGVNRNHLHAMNVSVPDLTEQRRIAGILSAYDDLIENCERRIRLLDEMARALYREWFVLFRYPGHEKTPLVDSALGKTPQGWAVTSASQALTINPKVGLPREGERPFVPMGSLSNSSMLISEIETRNVTTGAKFQNGDTLMARITPCLENGKTGFVQFLPDANSAACGSTEFIVLRGRAVPPRFAYCLARSEEFRQHAIKSMSGATGRQRVQEACFDQFFLAQPPRELLSYFDALIGPSFELSQVLHQRIDKLRKTRDLLLPRLLSGQLSIEDAA